MARKVKSTEEFKDLLAKIPQGSERVQVKDAKTGKLKYKPTEELTEFDDIQVNKDGIPVTMRSTPGRPKAVVIKPVTRMAEEIVKRKAEALASDPILKVARTNPEDPDVLHQIVLALGEEAASLRFERTQAELAGEKTSEVSVRAVNALKAVGDVWLKRKDQLTSRGIDMNSPAYRIFMKEVMAAFREALSSSGARPEMVETVFTKLAKIMNEDWESEVKNRMKIVI